ncbi:C-terminal motor kinesin, putative, partial [Trypanosoma cruzi]
YVTNLTEVPVNLPKEIHDIMARANRCRSEGQTNMNEHSSRSHMVLYIVVRTTNKQTRMQSFGKLSLVDLAGSERLEKSGAEGQQMKEAVSINKSLSALGDVISGLAQNNKHVPFRNSVLTFLLQDSMSGQAKVLMFVCVSPASYNCSESNSSLQFASRARGVAFGQIKKNTVVAT